MNSNKIVSSAKNISTTTTITHKGRAVKNAGTWQYEYFHKDHLGNSRVVYGYQKQVDEFKATMETQLATKEQGQFYNIATTRVTAFNRTPASIDVVLPDKSAETNGNLNKAIGPAKMLQVTAGDRVQLEVFARYNTGTGTNNTLITNLASAVTGSFMLTAGEAAHTALTNNVPVRAATISQTSGVPKAYLFYILFNSSYVYQQFGFVAVNSTALVGHQQMYLDITIPTGGFLYTYVANEANVSTATSVYFDDFSIIHTRSTPTLQVLQTTDYYPFGLSMAAQSYQKQSSLDNDYLYNGKELQDEHNLGWMDYGARMYMSDIGRWGVVDPKTELVYHWTPYRYGYNNPIRFFDRDGMTEEERQKAVEWLRAYMKAHGKDAYAYTTNDCASTVAGAIKSTGNFGDLREGLGIRGFGNGVARIVSMARKIKKNEARMGDILTFKTTRKTHQGVDGEFDHIGMVTKVNVDEKGNVIGYRVIQTGTSGTREIDIDLNKDKDWIQLKGAWQWDTEEDNNIYQGPELEPVVITGERIERKERLPEGLDENYRRPGRTADQNYSPEFLKWWYSISEKK